MEKTKNNYYKACAILSYIFGSLTILSGLILVFVATCSTEFYEFIYNDALVDYGGTTNLAVDYAMSVVRLTIGVGVMTVLTGPVTIVEGVMFGKLSELTDQEASEKYAMALTWSIVSFFFGGLLIGGLALGGLYAVQNPQRLRYLASKTAPIVVKEEPKKDDKELSLERIDRANERLRKIDELKKSGALTEDEYSRIRAEIVKSLFPEEKKEESKAEEVKVEEKSVEEKLNSRVAKLEKLKESGAISEEEFEVLKAKIESENK